MSKLPESPPRETTRTTIRPYILEQRDGKPSDALGTTKNTHKARPNIRKQGQANRARQRTTAARRYQHRTKGPHPKRRQNNEPNRARQRTQAAARRGNHRTQGHPTPNNQDAAKLPTSKCRLRFVELPMLESASMKMFDIDLPGSGGRPVNAGRNCILITLACILSSLTLVVTRSRTIA